MKSFLPLRPSLSLILGSVLSTFLCSGAAFADKCLFISSYHQGYAWSDGVERGLRSVLEGKCELRQFNMNTKRQKKPEKIKEIALEVRGIIEDWQPDVVITADDNAAKYVIQEHYRDDPLPFVFCGVNWTVEEYGFPYANTTGMVEVAPVNYLLEQVRKLQPNHERALYIGADTLTERKNLARYLKAKGKHGLQIDARLVNTSDAWLDAYRQAQAYDFVIIGSNSGIANWDETDMVQSIRNETRRLSITTHEWMMPYTMLGFTKVPEEQGEWAGNAALSILDGARPTDIPIVPNRKWDVWTNPVLLEASCISLPKRLRNKSKKVS